MERNNTPTLLVPLLALLAILFPFASVVRSPSSPAQTTPQTKQPKPRKGERSHHHGLPRYGAASLIEDFLHARRDRRTKTGWTDKDPRSQYCLHFMIATLPDPIDSSMPYFFDSFLDSIQRAFEADGYVLDRYHLAWSEPPPKTAETEEAKEPDNTPRYRWTPGILLFRKWIKAKDKGKLVLVFLVGETPTSGIHKAAMANALRQLGQFFPWGPRHEQLPKELRDLTHANSKTTIKIMGPTFSGSAKSVDFVLRDWLAKLGNSRTTKRDKFTPTFEIISGTATAVLPQEFSRIGSTEQVTFKAVVPPDRDTILPIIAYIKNLGKVGESKIGFTRIAMLSEANTAYGQQKFDGILNLPFPMHISELRAASEKQRLLRQKTSSPVTNNSTPPIPMEDGQSSPPKEIPPSYSDLEVSSSELVLSRILSTISHEGYHAVGIMATDVRDTIFLAREIHQHCPDTLVFTLNSDLFYMHPDVGSSARGMLVFTPYPLFNLDQVWTTPSWGQKSRLQFPSQAAEGVYNATLALLGEEWKMLDYGKPFSREGQGTAEEPALWITVVGRNGPLPVGVLSLEDHSEAQKVGAIDPGDATGIATSHYSLIRKPPPPKPDELPQSPTIDQEGIYTAPSALGMALLGVVIVAFSWMVFREYRSPDSLKRASRLFGEPFTKDYQPKARLFLLACLVSLLSFYLLVTVVYFLPTIASVKLGIFDFKLWQLFIAFTLAAGLRYLIGAIIVIFRAFWKGPRQNSLLRPWVIGSIFVGCVWVILLSLRLAKVWLSDAWGREPWEAIFRYVRAFEFSSGLSPLVPFFCLALAGFLWAFCAFLRLRMIDGMRPAGNNKPRKNCLLGANTPSFRGVKTLEADVRDLLEKASVFPARWYVDLIVVVLFFAMYLYFFFLPFVPSYEGTQFYFLFGWAFLFVFTALTVEFFRLCLVWRALRRLLQRLAVHPMQAAYGRYHKKFSGLPRFDLTIPLRIYTMLSFSVDQAEQLLRLASSEVWSPTLRRTERRALQRWIQGSRLNVQAAARNLSEALECEAKEKWRDAIPKRSQCQQALGQLTRLMAQILEPTWRTRKIAAPPDKESPEFQTFRQLGEEFLAGRAVLLLSYVLPALRNLGALILSGLLLMLFSVVSYPFLQRNHFLVFSWIVILGFVGLALTVMLQMERDAVISALNGTKPGQVTLSRQFTFRFLTYVMIPILALLGAQFPDTVGQILSWFSSTPGH